MTEKAEQNEKRSRLGRALFLFFLAAAFAFSLLPGALLLPADPAAGADLCAAIVRAAAAAAILCLLFSEGMLRLRVRLAFRAPSVLLATAFAFLIAVNNFPFEVLFFSGVRVQVTPIAFFLYLFSTLSTATFEEALFRGLLFPLVRARTGRGFGGELRAILFSSAAFGLLHLVNLIEAPLPDTLLQVGYSFLIGMLASLLYLFTDSLLPPILFHAVYNFGGLFLPAFGGANQAPLVSVLITVLLSVCTAVASAAALCRFAREAERGCVRASGE